MFFLTKLVKFYLLKHLPLLGLTSRLLLQSQPQPDFLLLSFASLWDAIVNSLQKPKTNQLTPEYVCNACMFWGRRIMDSELFWSTLWASYIKAQNQNGWNRITCVSCTIFLDQCSLPLRNWYCLCLVAISGGCGLLLREPWCCTNGLSNFHILFVFPLSAFCRKDFL